MIKIFEEANRGFNSGTSDSHSVSSLQEMIDPSNSKPNSVYYTKSNVSDYADPSTKMPSYIDPED